MPNKSLPSQAFISSGNGMAQAATIHKDTPFAQGLSSTFIDDLEAGVESLETSQSDREKSRVQRVNATKGLLVEEKNGEPVPTVLDALVRQALAANNDSLLRKWESVHLIRRTTVNARAAPAASTSTGVTAPDSSAVASVPASTSTPAATAA